MASFGRFGWLKDNNLSCTSTTILWYSTDKDKAVLSCQLTPSSPPQLNGGRLAGLINASVVELVDEVARGSCESSSSCGHGGRVEVVDAGWRWRVLNLVPVREKDL